MIKYIISVLFLFISINTYACNIPEYNSLPINSTTVSESGIRSTRTVEGPFSIEEVEKMNTYAQAGKTVPMPFGGSNEKWKKFKELYEAGDQLFLVKSTAKTECCNNYLDKYIMVRDGCVMYKHLIRSLGIIESPKRYIE